MTFNFVASFANVSQTHFRVKASQCQTENAMSDCATLKLYRRPTGFWTRRSSRMCSTSSRFGNFILPWIYFPRHVVTTNELSLKRKCMLPEEEIRERYLQFKKDCPSGFLSRCKLVTHHSLIGFWSDNLTDDDCCRSKFLDIIGGGMGPDAEEVVDGIFKVFWFLYMLTAVCN